jgi:TonB family protein
MNDVSPRLIVVFRSVRARLLPATTRDLYASARTSFDNKNFDLAAAQLRELLALIGDATDGGLADLKVLAEGFLKLAESARPALPTDPAAEKAGESPSAAGTQIRAPVYSILDRNVVGPVEITRPVPTMVAPKGTEPGFYQGLIEVIIDENGRVESAVVRSIAPAFDAELLAAAAKWRFQPATRDNKPVKPPVMRDHRTLVAIARGDQADQARQQREPPPPGDARTGPGASPCHDSGWGAIRRHVGFGAKRR